MHMRWVAWGLCLVLLAGCNVKTEDGAGDLDDALDEINDDLQDSGVDLDDLEICPGYTLPELFSADSLSPECRQELLSYLPEPEATFESKLLSPGGARVEEGELHMLLEGVDADGAAISADALATATVSVMVDGEWRVLEEGEYSITLTADLPADLLSIAVVNDYSASMLTGDLRDVADVEQTLYSLLPPIHESEVIRFSTEVDTTLPFTADADALNDALAYDADFERATTALIDGLGTSATDLSDRERPVKIIVLSTDGGENASTMYMKDAVLAQLDDDHVFVIALGALLADVDFMRELTRGRGVFVYTREFRSLQTAVLPFLESLKELVEVHIPPMDPPPSAVHIEYDGMELMLTPVP